VFLDDIKKFDIKYESRSLSTGSSPFSTRFSRGGKSTESFCVDIGGFSRGKRLRNPASRPIKKLQSGDGENQTGRDWQSVKNYKNWDLARLP
jgi:hypothetical protein